MFLKHKHLYMEQELRQVKVSNVLFTIPTNELRTCNFFFELMESFPDIGLHSPIELERDPNAFSELLKHIKDNRYVYPSKYDEEAKYYLLPQLTRCVECKESIILKPIVRQQDKCIHEDTRWLCKICNPCPSYATYCASPCFGSKDVCTKCNYKRMGVSYNSCNYDCDSDCD